MSATATVSSWDDIRFFLAIHRAGSLSAAARPLGVTQPTCGRRLAALEASLGVQLFERTRDGLRVTRDGHALLEAAASMESGAQQVALRASMGHHELAGVVRIGTTEAFACTFLVGALAVVQRHHPAIGAQLVISNAEADLLKGEADVAIRFGPAGYRPRPASLSSRRLGDEPFRLYASQAYLARRGLPGDGNALEAHDVVVFEGRHPAAEYCARAFRGAKVALSAPSIQVVTAAVAEGLGLGVLPERVAREVPALRSVSPVVARASGWLLIHPQLRRVPRIKAVVELLVGLFHQRGGAPR